MSAVRTDYRTGLPVPEKFAGILYSPRDLFAPKLAADEAPIIAARAELKARSEASVAASRAKIAENFAEFEASQSTTQQVAA